MKSKLQNDVFFHRYGHKADCVVEAFEQWQMSDRTALV